MSALALVVDWSHVSAAIIESHQLGPVTDIALPIDRPSPRAAEVSAERLWEAAARAARQAVRHAGVAGLPGRDTMAIALSCPSDAIVLLGAEDRPLLPIWTGDDRRWVP